MKSADGFEGSIHTLVVGFGPEISLPAGEIVASIMIWDGWQPCEVRYRNLTETGVEIFIEEEQSKDEETNHTSECVDDVISDGSNGGNAASASGMRPACSKA